MVVRSSLHRTKYSRGRPNAKKPDVQRELPPELRVQQLLTFDQANYDLRGRVCELLSKVPSVGICGDRLEDFAMAPDAWASKDLQCKLTEAVLGDDAFLGEYDRFVREVCAVHVKKRHASSSSTLETSTCLSWLVAVMPFAPVDPPTSRP